MEELTVNEFITNIGVDMLHAGGMRRTDELVKMCKIKGGQTILDVGCGYGRTACYLAKKYACK
jgi:cyclopropane fatty-acyl-phospholipid synthase-like methyltransferase